MDKKSLIGIVLSVILVFVYLNLMNKMNKKPISKKIEQKVATQSKPSIKDKNTDQKELKLAVLSQKHIQKTLILENKRLILHINTKGGRIEHIYLKDYNSSDGKSYADILKANKNNPLSVKIGNYNIAYDSNLDNAVYNLVYSEKKRIILQLKIKINGILYLLKKEYSLNDDQYGFNFRLYLKNLSNQKVNLTGKNSLVLAWQGSIDSGYDDSKSRQYSPLEYVYYTTGLEKVKRKNGIEYNTPDGVLKLKVIDGNISWIGLNSRYYLISLIPSMSSTIKAFFDITKPKRFHLAYAIDISLNPGEEKSLDYFIYSGIKDHSILKVYGKGLEDTIRGWSIIKPFRFAILWLLEVSYRLIKNYGVAIIVLTLVIKLLLSPLSLKSASSMRKMQALQPKINDIKEKYKDDAQLMNAKIMELYKKEGVNPMGGCLPVLFQLPIFFALYSALNDTISLRYSSFLWIKDLSAPDTVAHLPFSIPFIGTNLNVLPIIMVAVQLIQQRLNSVADPNQKMMMYLMPIVFLAIFWNMPSGLVLYWTVQNILSIVEQEIQKLRERRYSVVKT